MLTVKTLTSSFTVPSAWQEVTLAQFMELQNLNQDTGDESNKPVFLIQHVLAVLASDGAALRDIEAAEELQLISHLAFMTTAPDFLSLPVPELIAGVKPPKELGTCPLIQKWSVEGFIRDFNDEKKPVNYISLAVPLLSVYLYTPLTSTKLTSTDQLEEIAEVIGALPVTEALPLSAFFLRNYRSSTSSGRTSFVISYPKPQRKPWLKTWFGNWRPIKSMLPFRGWPSRSASATTKPGSYPTVNS